jgi:SAM-dependent methyltransferase
MASHVTKQYSSGDMLGRVKSDISKCPVCSDPLHLHVQAPISVYATETSFDIYRCSSCGLGVTLPVPTLEELSPIYAKTYAYDSHALIASEKRWRARRVLDLIRGVGISSLLDVGCMHGELLGVASDRGIDRVEGIELSEAAATRGRLAGFSISCTTIERYVQEHPEPFDVIVAQHVLEHAHDFRSFLTAAHSLLRQDGKLIVCVPHFGSWMQRVFRRTWGWYQVPVHLLHYSPRALELACRQSGFEVEKVGFRGGDSIMILLTLLYAVKGPPKTTGTPVTRFQRVAISLASAALRPYYYLGSDEIIAVARKA